jgi:hypothetical protein
MGDDDEDEQEIGAADQQQVKKEKKPKEEKKKFDPPAPREKTTRGDYVVTKFVIPDRVSQKKEHLEEVNFMYIG